MCNLCTASFSSVANAESLLSWLATLAITTGSTAVAVFTGSCSEREGVVAAMGTAEEAATSIDEEDDDEEDDEDDEDDDDDDDDDAEVMVAVIAATVAMGALVVAPRTAVDVASAVAAALTAAADDDVGVDCRKVMGTGAALCRGVNCVPPSDHPIASVAAPAPPTTIVVPAVRENPLAFPPNPGT